MPTFCSKEKKEETEMKEEEKIKLEKDFLVVGIVSGIAGSLFTGFLINWLNNLGDYKSLASTIIFAIVLVIIVWSINKK